MNMQTAIALSPGNKARAYNDESRTVIVQKCISYDFNTYNITKGGYRTEGREHVHYYVWLLGKGQVVEEAIEKAQLDKVLRAKYLVDPEGDYWSNNL